MLLLLLLSFVLNQLEASDRRDTAASPEKMLIYYSRNNRKKYFFQGREIGKIEDTNLSAAERSREPLLKEKTQRMAVTWQEIWYSHAREAGLVSYICFLHGPMSSHSSQYDSNCRTALTVLLLKVRPSFPLPSYRLQEFIPLSWAIFYPETHKHTLNLFGKKIFSNNCRQIIRSKQPHGLRLQSAILL